jgi:hypothetical protein
MTKTASTTYLHPDHLGGTNVTTNGVSLIGVLPSRGEVVNPLDPQDGTPAPSPQCVQPVNAPPAPTALPRKGVRSMAKS